MMIFKAMRSVGMVMAAVAALASPARAAFVTVNSFSDILLWAGAGANEAGLVLQFGDSQDPTSIAWGYRWDGVATVQDMLFAIAGTTTIVDGSPVPAGLDNRLVVDGTQYVFDEEPAVFLDTITYNQMGLPAPWSQVSRVIEDDWFNTGTSPVLYLNATASGLWTGATMAFDYSEEFGMAGLVMADGGWYGFVQTGSSWPEPEPPFAFTQPVSAVPEPSTWALGAGAVVIAILARRRARHRS